MHILRKMKCGCELRKEKINGQVQNGLIFCKEHEDVLSDYNNLSTGELVERLVNFLNFTSLKN